MLLETLTEQASYIQDNFIGKINIISPIEHDNLIIFVDKGDILNFLTFLKSDKNLSFKLLLDIFGADMLGQKNPRFDVIYNLLSLKLNSRITIKVSVDEDEQVKTSSFLFSCANWFEREIFDMYGIVFSDHPDLRRILTDYNFEGYPLRKDFPLTGHKEVHYDEKQEKVIYAPVKLMQEYRDFDFQSPWVGSYPAK